MSITLSESSHRGKRRSEWTLASIAAHALVLAVWFTAKGWSAPPAPHEETIPIRYSAPRPTEARPERPMSRASAASLPVLPSIPHLDPPSIELLALPERPLGSPVPEPSAFDRRAFTIRLGGPSAGSPSADGPHTAYTVDRPVQPRDGNPVPRYPAVLASAGVEGTVTAQFVVDTLGAVERGSIRLARSTHVLFADAVTATLQHMRFVPAQAGGRMVRQLVEQSFQFTIRR